MTISHHDVVIIGSGAAGLTAAINLAQDRKVLVLAKGALDSGSTNWAQGGIAAVLDAGDSFANHVEDTMVAGGGLNDRSTVEFVVSEAPAAIERLAALGVPFNDGDEFGERWRLDELDRLWPPDGHRVQFGNEGRAAIGVQAVARYAEDGLLLGFAAQLERAKPWANRKPKLA